MGKTPLTVGLIGHRFMGRAHSNAYRQAGRFFDLPREIRMKTICGRNESDVQEAAGVLGWERHETDWRRVVSDPEIDLIDVCTPGDLHAEISIAAAQAGRAVLCEKPLANTLTEANLMTQVAKDVPNGVFHNYRKAPAVALAKQMVEGGDIGDIYHFRAAYLQDWIVDPSFPLVWRLQRAVAGSGALGDLGSHIIDLGRHLVGNIKSVVGNLNTFITERPLEGSSEQGKVDVDDAATFICKFENGAIGSFEATRFAQGRKNHNTFEINGSRGSLVFNLERMNELQHYDAAEPEDRRGFTTIQVTESSHPYVASYWPPGHIIGYEHTFVNYIADAVLAIDSGAQIEPNFEEGLQNQRVLDAIERSVESHGWIAL